RGGAIGRDDRAALELAAARGLEAEVHRAEQGLDADGGAGLAAELVTVGGDAELHPHRLPGELESLDLPDTHTGQAHVVALLQSAHPAELGGVRGAPAEDRQSVRLTRHQQQRGDDEQGDRPDGDRIALADRLHVPQRHRLAPAPVTVTRLVVFSERFFSQPGTPSSTGTLPWTPSSHT